MQQVIASSPLPGVSGQQHRAAIAGIPNTTRERILCRSNGLVFDLYGNHASFIRDTKALELQYYRCSNCLTCRTIQPISEQYKSSSSLTCLQNRAEFIVCGAIIIFTVKYAENFMPSSPEYHSQLVRSHHFKSIQRYRGNPLSIYVPSKLYTTLSSALRQAAHHSFQRIPLVVWSISSSLHTPCKTSLKKSVHSSSLCCICKSNKSSSGGGGVAAAEALSFLKQSLQ